MQIQDKAGATALLFAYLGIGSKLTLPLDVHRLSDDYQETVRLLLSYGADPLAIVGIEGVLVSPFDMACAYDNIGAVEVILAECNIPTEAVVQGLCFALLHGIINTSKLLQSKISDVDVDLLAINRSIMC